ncbi:MAG: valine--tRNA ligase [Nitrospiria bacterium]
MDTGDIDSIPFFTGGLGFCYYFFMFKELSKTYDFKEIEPRQYQKWLDEGLFHADVRSSAPSFSMVIPPPNITGVLHMGHALNNTLQDILARWKRMRGFNVLWVPGTDHAGIATQNIVEKQLLKEKKKKEDIGREEFIRNVWEWKEHSGRTIIQQLKRLGSSCDWERERFTMDEGLSRAVEEVFIRLYHEGLIYRSERLINWCIRCQTALSDIEVIHEEVEGALYYIHYPLVDDQQRALQEKQPALPVRNVGFGGIGGLYKVKPHGTLNIIVATTRPETLLGDTAVAVHPEDPRYQSFFGKKVLLPLADVSIPVISDSAVDKEFGSGAVKVTPGHDFNDYEMGVRHNLPLENILTPAGRIVSSARTGEFAGMDIPTARQKVVARLKEAGYLIDIKKHLHAVGKCHRCHTVVEPYLSNQWFVRISPLALPAIEAVRKGDIEFIPDFWKNTYFAWMENIKDWCISRQLWWGHQIPAWYCLPCHPELKKGNPFLFKSLEPVVSSTRPKGCRKCGGNEFIREPDVLDTWFSSALWPFSTLGWPGQTEELKKFYPTSVLSTGFDIIFFWVARMIMMGLKFRGEVPFKKVYFHALVRDAEGQKMSKSRGNVIDPIALMDRYGTDALRFTLASMAAPGRDILLDEDRFAGYRNFCNKIWNAARFILLNLKNEEDFSGLSIRPSDTLPDQWIVIKLNECARQVNQSLEQFRFDEAANALYHFIWHEYCDWYLEFIKPVLLDSEARSTRHTMTDTFRKILLLLHPFMPFISEAIWPFIGPEKRSLLTLSYPQAELPSDGKGIDKLMENLKEIIKGLRSIRGENNIPPGKELNAYLHLKEGAVPLLEEQEAYIKKLARLSRLIISSQLEKPAYCATYVCHPGTLYVDLTDISDPGDEVKRLEKQIEKINLDLSLISKKFENPNFAKNAPEKIVKEEENRRKTLEEKKLFLSEEIHKLSSFL